jgi:hypothetical protein
MEGEQASYSEITGESVFQDVPEPDLPSCPIYQCKSGQSSCLKKVNHDLVTTTILSDICKSSERCSVDESAKSADAPRICVTQDDYTNNGSRWSYPGEKCKKDSYCVGFELKDDGTILRKNTFCDKEKTCEGVAAGGKCSDTEHCVAGHFCDNSAAPTEKYYPGKCTKLIAAGSSCKGKYDKCQSHLICSSEVCTELYKATGTIKEPIPKLCKSLFFKEVKAAKEGDASTYTCVNVKLSGDVDKKTKTKLCKKNSDCAYTDESNTAIKIEGACQCGVNSKDERYCMLPYVGNESVYDEYVKQQLLYITDAKDETHASQTPLESVRKSDKVRAAGKKSAEYVKWFKSDSCAYKVLSSGYIQISAAILLILAFIF